MSRNIHAIELSRLDTLVCLSMRAQAWQKSSRKTLSRFKSRGFRRLCNVISFTVCLSATYVVDSQVTADQTRSSDGHVATVKTEFETEAPTRQVCLPMFLNLFLPFQQHSSFWSDLGSEAFLCSELDFQLERLAYSWFREEHGRKCD